MTVNNDSEVLLLALLSSFLLSFLFLLDSAVFPVLGVLLLVQCGSTLGINELVVRDEHLLVLGLELDHLLEWDHIVLAAAVQPEQVDHLTLDPVAESKLVAV